MNISRLLPLTARVVATSLLASTALATQAEPLTLEQLNELVKSQGEEIVELRKGAECHG